MRQDFDTAVFDETFMRKLERLTLLSRRLRHSYLRGEHRSHRHGAGLDFADYRSYQPGDDFRYIDWNIFSRLDRLFVKVFNADDRLEVHFLLDTSASMAFGTPSKLAYGKRLTGALAYVAVHGLDRVGIRSFADSLGPSVPSLDKRADVFRLFSYLSGLESRGGTDLSASLTHYAQAARRPGLTIVLSDFLSAPEPEPGLRAMLARGFDLLLVQVLEPSELRPPMRGTLRLIDAETDDEEEVAVDGQVAREYRERLDAYSRRISRFCLEHRMEFVRLSTDISLEDAVLKHVQGGLFVR